jgi:hypothetical protein
MPLDAKMKRATAAQEISLDGDAMVDDQLYLAFAKVLTSSASEENEWNTDLWTGPFNGDCRWTTTIKARSRARTTWT